MSIARAAFALYLITDRKLSKKGLVETCEEVLIAAGDDAARIAIQLREKDLTGQELLALAKELRRITTAHRAKLLINDRIDVALACDADGVHLPADSFSVRGARELLGKGKLIGCSTHSIAEVEAANRAGADFVVFGPVFDPISKAAYGPATGIDALREACDVSDIPVYALGGITPERIEDLADCEIAGVGAIGAVFGVSSPPQGALTLLKSLPDCSISGTHG
ncbi:MAG TPA: thiamine phosphate synthase [Candidatus Binataceae bacterium]|nr:thiamine phosphate synthase [Candidatus Binataceae bacterium]